MRSILSTALLLYIGFCSVASAQLLDAYLPKSGVIAGQAMELGATPEAVRVSTKLQAAIQKNQAWFTSYAAKVKEGDPLPYDRRLGVTKAEYDVILNAKMVLTPKGAVSIKVKTDAKGNLEFASEGIAGALNGVRVPSGQKYAENAVRPARNVFRNLPGRCRQPDRPLEGHPVEEGRRAGGQAGDRAPREDRRRHPLL